MRICIVAEGSYPYILGGVSSWINTITRSFPEHEFVIFAISANSSCKGKYKYQLSQNVVEVKDVFLDNINIQLDGGKKGKKYKFSKLEKSALRGLLNGDITSWDNIFNFFKQRKINNASEFFLSKNFFNLVEDLYIKEYPYTPFTEFLWTIRSMYLILFYLLSCDIPKADIYHSVSTGYAGIIASYAKFLYNKPFILSEHGIYTREREEEIIKANWVKGYYKEIWIKYFYNLSIGAYKGADIVTSLFETNKTLQTELGCPQEKITIIPNGVDVSKFEHIKSNDDNNVINIGAIIRVVPIKDIKTMVKSFQLVKDKIHNSKFYIMGPTDEEKEYYKECIQLVEQLDIKDVVFTGSINILEYVGKMDILVLTSISEGQPLAVMEGMAAKKPHVCTNVGDCKDLLYGVDDYYGQAGFIQYVMDYNSIANSIIKLCKNKKLRNEMGISGYNRVSNLYKKESFIRKYKELYKKFGSE